MLTTNDQLAREVLIATHDWFSADREHWTRGTYVRKRGCLKKRVYARCMVGEIAHRLGLTVNSVEVYGDTRHPNHRVYLSLLSWFTRRISGQDSPQQFNDAMGYDNVLKFLGRRIAELDAALLERAGLPDLAPVYLEYSVSIGDKAHILHLPNSFG